MRIVSWNCNGAFRKKYQQLANLEADIHVIQECENPALCPDENYKIWAKNCLWTGDNKNKGLGIFCSADIKMVENEWERNGTKYFLSANINDSFNLLAVWNHHANSPNFRYIGQLWKYLQVNKQFMVRSLVVGDFNSNTIWDEWDRWWNHSDVVRELKEIGIRSLYHECFNEKQGQESTPTFFLQKNVSKRYHIDYAFADASYFDTIISLSIGHSADWLSLSDHMPLIVDI
jgi:exonuclease III